MAGTSEGNKKAAAEAKRRYGSDFHSKIGSKSWQNPDRSRVVGFAKNPQLAKVAGAKGGRKKKHEEESTQYITAEELAAIAKVEEDGPGISE